MLPSLEALLYGSKSFSEKIYILVNGLFLFWLTIIILISNIRRNIFNFLLQPAVNFVLFTILLVYTIYSIHIL